MAHLKSIKQKEKQYIFNAYGNSENENPAKAIFSRFPLQDEVFPVSNPKNVLESNIVKNFDNTQKAKEQLVEHIINTMIDNLTANRVNYNKFLEECVGRFENLIYDNREIKTINDFLTLPDEAVFKISQELYLYSKQEDEFSMGESAA